MDSRSRGLPPVGRPPGGTMPGYQQPRGPQRQALPPLGGPIVPYQPPQQPPPQGDPGYAGGGGAPWGADMRRLDGVWQRRFDETLGQVNQRLDSHEGHLGELIKVTQNPVLSGLNPGLGALGLGEAVQRAVYTGRCLPYDAVVDIFVPAGTAGQQLQGSIFVTQDGPMFIARVLGYAQIDQADARAKNFPASLIDPPLCGSGNALDQANASFTVKCGELLPGLDVSGMFIPISPRNCPLISSGTASCCGTLICEGQPDTQYNVREPILTLSHPECFDGLIEIFTNDCGWQSVAYPMAKLEDAAFDITNESPNCIGVCGFVDCNKVLKVGITPTRPLKFGVNVQIVFAGFRVLTCGGPACSTG